VSATRTYEIFNQNGWGRSLHFLAAWVLVATGAFYVVAGVLSGHVRRDLVPHAGELSPGLLWLEFANHLRLRIRRATGGPQYGLLQKCAYLTVVFVLVPLVIATGLAMSPAVNAAYPLLPRVFGGTQSARTIHFALFVSLLLFLAAHLLMVALSGFARQIRAMTIGKQA
jgi:thiosulfate reductase cytochrome b subunit